MKKKLSILKKIFYCVLSFLASFFLGLTVFTYQKFFLSLVVGFVYVSFSVITRRFPKEYMLLAAAIAGYSLAITLRFGFDFFIVLSTLLVLIILFLIKKGLRTTPYTHHEIS